MEEGTAVPSFVVIHSKMIAKDTVIQLIDDYLKDTEYYLVDLRISTDNHISIEIDSFRGVSIAFCAEMNRHIESKLNRDVEDYELEVSSAGLTEPFKVLKQYEKNIGNEVETVTTNGKRYSGILLEAGKDAFTLEVEKTVKPDGAKRKITISEKLTFNYHEIKKTTYIIRFK